MTLITVNVHVVNHTETDTVLTYIDTVNFNSFKGIDYTLTSLYWKITLLTNTDMNWLTVIQAQFLHYSNIGTHTVIN